MLRKYLVFAAALLAAPIAFAQTTHNVTVTGFTFTPASLNIQAGDSVTFSYSGGGAQHNVATESGSVTNFRCATDCTATGGNPTASAWSFTIMFPTEGDVTYFCEVHGGPGNPGPGGTGMAGTITVGPVPVELQSFDIE